MREADAAPPAGHHAPEPDQAHPARRREIAVECYAAGVPVGPLGHADRHDDAERHPDPGGERAAPHRRGSGGRARDRRRRRGGAGSGHRRSAGAARGASRQRLLGDDLVDLRQLLVPIARRAGHGVSRVS